MEKETEQSKQERHLGMEVPIKEEATVLLTFGSEWLGLQNRQITAAPSEIFSGDGRRKHQVFTLLPLPTAPPPRLFSSCTSDIFSRVLTSAETAAEAHTHQ